MYDHCVQKGLCACEHSPFPSLTAKCTAQKCSSPVLYVYLILLLFKEKSGENYSKREGWTDDAPSRLNRDVFICFCVSLKP